MIKLKVTVKICSIVEEETDNKYRSDLGGEEGRGRGRGRGRKKNQKRIR